MFMAATVVYVAFTATGTLDPFASKFPVFSICRVLGLYVSVHSCIQLFLLDFTSLWPS